VVSDNHPRSAGWLARVDTEARPTRSQDDLRVAI